ncbi:MAG: YhdH/YhfP family quinone oxidoreductase [Pseudomonadales bacterium]|jgi:acrylyl-CoA reductase (NADPH)|nr:YhdH/YhfP family quinone oxidoreductase [Pseudomonadales bacterium]MBL6808708.1 YhdH/YhfP family quinone oxidoreductase [Pseudomonadales bacterium]MDA0955306.1 YhdH/YhfP family quinone oxidoreductase [Pseudomonadota bacterium]
MGTYRALVVHREGDALPRQIETLDEAALPEGDVLIEVHYSSLNYKDGLSAQGNPGVTRHFPHTPGIDASGIVLESRVPNFAPGDAVIVIGFDLGMGTAGGFGERIRVPAGWVVPCPKGLTLRSAMALGTAGFTAAECVDKLERMGGLAPAQGPVLVTGATGGVGSVAVMLLAQLGYDVVAVTGKAERADWLKGLGAGEVMTREALAQGASKPLLAERFAGAVDTVGGELLFNAVKSLRYGGSLAACGLVASPAIPATVLPFILRHVNLLGIDSVQWPLEEKTRLWGRLAQEWALPELETLVETLTLETVSDALDRILAGQMVGRGLLVHKAARG